MGSGKVEGGMKCVKWLMIIFNSIFFLVGLLLIVCGALIMTKFKQYVVVLGSAFNTAPIVIIVVGVVILLIAFLGCCGSWKENQCMVVTFAVIMLIILLLQFAAAIAGFIMRGKVLDVIRDPLAKALNSYNNSTKVLDYKSAIDEMQRSLKCCGINGPSDWKNVTGPNIFPDSCCVVPKTGTSCQPYQEGCIKMFGEWVSGNVLIVAGVAIGVCFVQLIGILFACCLARAIKKEYNVV